MVSAPSADYSDLDFLGDPEAICKLLAAKDNELKAQKLLIEKLMIELAGHKRHRFGTRSEGLDQLKLSFEDKEADEAVADHLNGVIRIARDQLVPEGTKQVPKRKALPSHLPRDAQTIAPSSTDCPDCGKQMRKLGEDIRELLDVVPTSFIVRQFATEKYSCRDCGTIVEGELPEQPIAKGAAGPGLLAHVLVSKYADALPLYRQSEIYSRQGIDLSRSTMAGWVGKMGDLLTPLAKRIECHVLSGPAVHTDDTIVPVQVPGAKKTKKGRIWAHVREERPWGSAIPPAAFYKFSPNRAGEHPKRFLKGYEGHLHVDGYSGYDALFESGKATQVSCLAHIRRKFFDVYKATASPLAEKAITSIAELYKIECTIKGRLAEDRLAVRQEMAKPIFDALEDWLLVTKPTLPAGQPLAKAMGYAINQMKHLRHYLDDGRLAVDNNAAERAVKNIVLGRKNYLFFGSDHAGERAAVIYTLIETAKLNRINPQAWLTDVIATIGECKQTNLDHLLPWNWAEG